MATIAKEAYVPARSAGNPPPHPKSQTSPHSTPRADRPDDEPRLLCPRSNIERAFADAECRHGVVYGKVKKEESGKMKSRFWHKWERTPQARSVSSATRELVRAILNIAGEAHHRYTADERRCVAVVWAGQRKIADRLGLSVHGVKQRMRAATRAGLIARTRRAYGRSSLTVLELVLPEPTPESVPNAGQSDCSGSRRETEFCPTVGQSSVPQSDRVQHDISDSAVVKSAAADSYDYHSDESEKGLSPSSGSKDTATPTASAQPTMAQKARVRECLMKLGVTANAAVEWQRDIEHNILASLVVVMAAIKKRRPTSRQAKDPKAMGAWIGSILFNGNQLPAWVRDELEGTSTNVDTALDYLDGACMIAEQEYPD